MPLGPGVVRIPPRLLAILREQPSFTSRPAVLVGAVDDADQALFAAVRGGTTRSDGSVAVKLPDRARTALAYYADLLARQAPTENDRRANVRTANAVLRQIGVER